MNERLYNCESCGGKTLLIQKVENINVDIQHNYFECANCKSKATIFYSDSELRKMIMKQQKTNNQVTKNSMQKIIEKRMSELREQYESAI
ncbi:hypothetical protein [Candidatus Enterococcus mansonii]|uniref:Transglycosylase n=1 Tax=Candidatus Enterococcus mansonii TaxID=1834181 RepID=A0A242CI86_9ENTE|nr:hypothetical protein [Enterococcus sp. 4G2_DIV0659]OTO09620.1 hypothetical protein A5880_000299 [Enterococcus sp. 4G2_DIV0659]